MKKNRMGKILTAVVLILTMATTSFAFADVKAQSQISWNDAKTAFQKKAPGAVLKYMRLTYDDGRKVYQGKGVKGSYVYDFEINAKNGKFVDFERDYEGSAYTASEIGSTFYKSEAKAKVLKKVPGARIIYVKLTRDDGRYIYEGEAYKNGYLYEFEMSAYSGKIREWDKEWAFED